jgi:phage FluMu protein Com
LKLDERIKCPHCEEVFSYTFHDYHNKIECQSCEKCFDIKLKTTVEVIIVLPKRMCWACNEIFIGAECSEDDNKCPKCGTKGGHYTQWE